MGRRKKEPKSVHRCNISSAAQELFMEKGIGMTSMDDIAKAAGYSKATIYVYFQNKEEIIGMLVLESMKKLHTYIESALNRHESTKARYNAICQALLLYQEEFPYYFKMALEKINIDVDSAECLPEDKETFHVGEEINEKLKVFLRDGMNSGDIRTDIKILPTIISFWGMLSGFIQTASNKEEYILRVLKLTRQEFLQYGFDTLFRSIAAKCERREVVLRRQSSLAQDTKMPCPQQLSPVLEER